MPETRAKLRLRKRSSGRIGSGDPALDEHERGERHHARATARPMICGEPQAYSVPPQVVMQHERGDADGEQAGAEPVDAVLGAVLRQVQHGAISRPARRRPAAG